MVTYVLDSSAVLRYLHDKAGSDRMAEIIKGRLAGDCEAIISAAHWGEVAGITCKLYGRHEMEQVLSRLSALGLQVVALDGDLAVRAAVLKLQRAIPYVDAFGIALTALARDRVFVTSDFDFKPASRDVTIEFLPAS